MTEVLTIRHLSKTFPGTVALDDAQLTVKAGEVHALIGQNGSGKSTLIKVLSGYHRADSGAEIHLYGSELEAQDLIHGSNRMRFVHQDLGLFNELTVRDNIALRSDFITTKLGVIDKKLQAEEAQKFIDEFDATIRVGTLVAELTPVQRTIVAICAALASRPEDPIVLVLDEPTAVLPQDEVADLLQIVRLLRERGDSIIYVSHRLDEVIEVADHVTVLRGGKIVASERVEGLNVHALAERMVGSEVNVDFRANASDTSSRDIALETKGLGGTYLQDFDFVLREGDVVGVAGLPGSGREELPYLLAGKQRSSSGSVIVHAKTQDIPIVPASRLEEAVIPEFSVAHNMTLSYLQRLKNKLFLSRKQERTTSKQWIDELSIKTSSPDASIMSLSGGNQQKTIIARGLMLDPKVIVLSEPTAGVDVGARQGIYELIEERSKDGLAVVVASTDLGDLLAICNKIIVLAGGRISHTFEGEHITETAILAAMES